MTVRNIVVMGGSFNPPKVAHLQLMQTALDGVGAQLGYFVPVSHAYLKRKMRRAEDGRMCLSENVRQEMLAGLCAIDGRMRISALEYGTVKARTYDTMVALQAQHPDAELHFVIGEDKLPQLKRWRLGVDGPEKFKFVVFDRGDDFARQRPSEVANARLDARRFVFLSPPPDVATVSSTAVRRAFLAGESVNALVPPSVAEVLSRFRSDDFAFEIWRFEGEHSFLSNRYKASVELDGFVFKTADAAFWALSCANEEDRRIIASSRPENAHRIAGLYPRVQGWVASQIAIMERIIRAKFSQHEILAEKLRATGRARLVWTNTVPDTFWGEDRYACVGENHLGQILMKVREELR